VNTLYPHAYYSILSRNEHYQEFHKVAEPVSSEIIEDLERLRVQRERRRLLRKYKHERDWLRLKEIRTRHKRLPDAPRVASKYIYLNMPANLSFSTNYDDCE
jgi:hypothetical protein